ncbi:MAG TPA: cupin domain-containing protein [bacterium]|nr:cupin domain-containing protein [bacterium]HPN43460.1 cupin domain-containing protein [bacterium]
MNGISINHNPEEQLLTEMGVRSWPIWEKEKSEFPWKYDSEEVCYLLEGLVTVTPQGGEPVSIRAGDLVTFPQGMACKWKIHVAVKKHYMFK